MHEPMMDDLQEACARVAHEAIRQYCIAFGEDAAPPWEQAPEWMRDSTRKGVNVAVQGDGPEAQHEAWCAERRASGWRHGPAKDAVLKTHPCLVPWTDLPGWQRAKDVLFLAVVRATALAVAGDTRFGDELRERFS